MLKQTALWLIYIFCLASRLASQEPAYLHYDVSDGLPSATIYSMIQDSRGFIWFATDKGLARFDGTRFRCFTMNDGLPDPEVLSIFEDSKNRLWLSCFRKKPCYWLNGKFITSDYNFSLGDIEMEGGNFSFFEDKNHNIWMADGSYKFCRWNETSVSCYGKKPYTVIQLNECQENLFAFGYWYISTIENQVFPDIVFESPPPFYLSELNLGSTDSLIRHHPFYSKPRYVNLGFSKNRVLYAYPEGLLLVEGDGKNFREIDRLLGFDCTNILTDKEGQFWIINRPNGIYRIDHKKNGLNNFTLFLPGKQITNFFEDNEGTFWFSTVNDGVYALPTNSSIYMSSENNDVFKSDNITAITKTRNGTLIAGDDLGNLYFRGNKGWYRHELGNSDGFNEVRQIIPFFENDWIAVTDEEIYPTNTNYSLSGLGAFKVAELVLGEMWIGTSGKLLHIVDNNVASVLNNRTMAIAADQENNIWIGGLEGLLSHKDSFQTQWGDKFLPLSSRILDIEPAIGNAIWVATPDYGLLNLTVSAGKVLEVKIINELIKEPIENIQSLYSEANGKLWISTNNGVYSLDINMEVNHYDEKTGLINNDVNAVIVNKDSLWAATASGISVVPLKKKIDKGNFSTFLMSVRYQIGMNNYHIGMLDTITSDKKLTLPAGTSLLEIEYAGLHFGSPGNLKFECLTKERILPLANLTWGNLTRVFLGKILGTMDTITVEGGTLQYGLNVIPGQYQTTVTTILHKNIRSNQPDRYTLTILPHWYQTIWFSLALAALGIFLVWRYVKTTLAVRQLESTASELQLQAIKAQINPHFVGNSINAIQQFFYPPDPLKASQYISIFSDLLRRTISLSEKKFIPIRDELSYILDYLEMIRLRFGDRFVYSLTGTENISSILPFPSMILQPLIENATIHGFSEMGTSKLQIDFDQHGDLLICTITDNGIGIYTSQERKKALGIKRDSKGLALLDKKIQTLNRLYNIEMKIEYKELSEQINGTSGTQAKLSFLPGKVDKSLLELQ